MNMLEWAKPQIEKAVVDKNKQKEFMKAIEEFTNQGHSGFSASYVISYLKLYSTQTINSIEERLNEINKNKDCEQTIITNNILSILKLFKKYNFTEEDCYMVCRLINWKPIVPLTGDKEEWSTCEIESGSEQNKLCTAVFRDDKDNSTAYYIYGKVFSDNGGISWFTNNNSFIPVTFPFIVPDESEKVYLDEEGNDITNDKEKIESLKKYKLKEFEIE